MQHIGITAHIKDFEVPFFIGYFKIQDGQDLRKSAAIACKRYSERRQSEQWLKRLVKVEIYDRETNKELLKIEL